MPPVPSQGVSGHLLPQPPAAVPGPVVISQMAPGPATGVCEPWTCSTLPQTQLLLPLPSQGDRLAPHPSAVRFMKRKGGEKCRLLSPSVIWPAGITAA